MLPNPKIPQRTDENAPGENIFYFGPFIGLHSLVHFLNLQLASFVPLLYFPPQDSLLFCIVKLARFACACLDIGVPARIFVAQAIFQFSHKCQLPSSGPACFSWECFRLPKHRHDRHQPDERVRVGVTPTQATARGGVGGRGNRGT